MSIPPGTSIGRFRIVRLIAQGGMAEVYRAEQDLTGGITRPVALKVIRPEYSESADFREMFLDEARTACTLSHPNIVHIYEVGEADGRAFMAMELVRGESLAGVNRRLRAERSRLPDDALLAVGIATCSALEAVHRLQLPGEGHLNLVHRDVSPHNLLLDPTGALKLIDFGIAKAATNRNLTMPGVTKGKAGYFSPEQAMGKSLDGRSDLFSLGITLYKLAAGKTPFDAHKTHQARNGALVSGKWEPLAKVAPGLPAGLYPVVDRALALRREDRFADAAEMREALERVAFEAGLRVGAATLAGYSHPVEGEEASVSSGRSLPLRPLPPPKPNRYATVRLVQTSLSALRGRRRRVVLGAGMAGALLAGLGVWGWERARSGAGWSAELRSLAGVDRPAAARSGNDAGLAPTGFAAARESSATDAGLAPTGSAATLESSAADAGLAAARESSARDAGLVSTGSAAALESGKTAAESRRVLASPVTPFVRAERTRAVVKKTRVTEPAGEPSADEGDGELRIGSSPTVQVWVAGKSRGETPLILTLPAGAHTVELVPKHGKKAVCRVHVVADRKTRLVYDFSDKRCELTSL